jgi:pyridoxamine 5'-phosphate oxidase-like protein
MTTETVTSARAATTAVTWSELEAAAPAITDAGRKLFYARGDGEAILATIRGDGLPRIHPVNIGLVDGRLYTFVIGSSAKRIDLERDGRYAIHSHQDPAAPSEIALRGHARRVDEGAERDRAAADWPFTVDATYVLFELTIAAALLGDRPTADDWPPRYTAWPGRAD